MVATTVPSEISSIPANSPCTTSPTSRSTIRPRNTSSSATRRAIAAPTCNGVVVYGTGYYYQPWIGSYWYGPPYTYGFGVSIAYTPWAGWHVGYGFGWSWGATTVAVGWGWGAYPWWGGYGWGCYYPWAYRPGYGAVWGPRGGAAVWGPGYWSGTTGNMYNRWGSTTAVTRRTGGYNAWTGNSWAGQAGRAYNCAPASPRQDSVASSDNVYSGNYAAGSRGACSKHQDGRRCRRAAPGTVGNAYTGNEVTGGSGSSAWTRRQHDQESVASKAKTAARCASETMCLQVKDGNVYKHNEGGGWDQVTRPEPRLGQQPGQFDRGQLDRERTALYERGLPHRRRALGRVPRRNVSRRWWNGGRRPPARRRRAAVSLVRRSAIGVRWSGRAH